MKSLEKLRILDGTALKIIAAVSMLIDHIGDLFFPGVFWMRAVGRIAMPVFAFCVAEGCRYTKHRGKYLLRLFLFALISELPFDLAIFGKIYIGHQNILFTFFLAAAGIFLFEWDEQRPFRGVLWLAMMALMPFMILSDYTIFAVGTVYIFYFLKDRAFVLRQTAGVLFAAVTRTMGYYAFTGISLIPLLMYNGEKGKGMKYFFYIFYPGHLLLLYLIRRVTG